MEKSQKIQHLYLMSAIFEAVENHSGIGDKALVETITNLCAQEDMDKFKPLPTEERAESDFTEQIKYLWQLKGKLKDILAPELDHPTPKEQKKELPIFQLKEALLKVISDNQILILASQTGDGKTTQLPQYLAEAGYSPFGQIACSQPRCVSTLASACHVAKEYSCQLGEEVSYSILAEECTSSKTKIKYISHSALLKECIVDPDLKQYSVIVIDDVHERTAKIDVLLGVMKQLCQRRTDLKLVITTATTDAAEKASKYFDSSPIFIIPGRSFPVEIFYAKHTLPDLLDAALTQALSFHLSQPPGDILVFLASQKEVEISYQILSDRIEALGPDAPALTVVPIISDLPLEIQSKIFEVSPLGTRKVLLAGSIAETSISIEGIRYVVDSGLVEQRVYNTDIFWNELRNTRTSKAVAIQRAGCAGFKAPGKAYRLYTEATYQNELSEITVPEIQRVNMARIVLTLKALGINDWHDFDFIDAPNEANMTSAVEALRQLGAIDAEGSLTEHGRKMALYP